jgi:hypothetical protein
MSEHTPRPWKVESSTDRYGRTSYAIVEVFNPEKPEEEANRQLIETAPDLLEALEAVANAYAYTGGIDDEIIEQVEQAIAKVKE